MRAKTAMSLGRSVLLGTVLTATVVLGAVTPAAADAARAAAPDCSFTKTVCLFEGANYTGARLTLSSWPAGSGACISLVEHGWANRAHSAYNTNLTSAALFMNDDCLGGPNQLQPGGTPTLNSSSVRSIWVP